MGLEYAFGGHWDSEQGIFDIKPFYLTRPEILGAYRKETGTPPATPAPAPTLPTPSPGAGRPVG
jgi:hypothetical protein